MLDLIERVGRVRVYTENNIRPTGTNLFQHIDIPARLHFDLDSTIASGQLRFNLLKKLVWRILNTDRNTASDFAAGSAEQFPKWLLFLSRFRIPYRVFERCFGHAVAANAPKPRCTIPP